MIKIAYVINYIVKNGPSSVVLNLINNLDKQEYDISLITLFSGNDEKVVTCLRNNDVKVFECKNLNRAGCLIGKYREFADIIDNEKFDVIHTHGLVPDVISSKSNILSKKITTIHNNMYQDYLDSYGYLKSRVFILMHLVALKKIDECVCCSESIFQIMRKKIKNVIFVRNGIEPAKAKTIVTKNSIGIPEDARVFLYAGALNTGKNIVWLIENFVRCHGEKDYLLILGKGEKEVECKQKADSHVKMLGFQTDPIAYMNISDVYVSASKSEGFSISILEALSCGLGLFLSDIPSHYEVVSIGKSVYFGEVFDEINFKSCYDKLNKNYVLINNDAIKREQQRLLSAKEMTRQYAEQYVKLKCS